MQLAQALCFHVQPCCGEHINYAFVALETPRELQYSMFSLPALSWRFVEDFAVPASLGFHLEVDLGVDIGRINRHVAEFNVLFSETVLLDVMHLRVQRNISVYNTFFTSQAE